MEEKEKTLKEKFESKNDEDIIEAFELWKKDAQSYHDELLRFQKVSEQYYLGNQTDRDILPEYLPNTTENRIFEATETIVPIATANAHQFMVMPGSEAPDSKSKAEKLGKILARKYQILEIQEKLETIVRNFILYRFGVLKWGWDYEADDIKVEVKDPRLIYLPRLRLDPHRLPYVMEIAEYSKDDLKNEFPAAPINELTPRISESDKKEEIKDRYDVWEVWTDTHARWISSGKVLRKDKNPYWDDEGETKIRLKGFLSRRKITETIFRNHFNRPEKPFIFFTAYRVGQAPLGDLSLAEVAIPLQDAINVQKRQIIHNLNQMGNGQVYVDADAMSQELAENITNEAGLVIRGEGVASQGKIKREAGVSLPAGHFDNLQHSESVFDNLMGVHSATRGQAQAKTLGQDMISRQQDFTRIDLITRVLNRGVSRLANALVQLMRLFYDETKLIKILGEEGASELIRFSRDDIEDHIEIDVKSGQTVQMDEVSLRTEAVQLWQLNAIGPKTLYERLKFPNPEKAAVELLSWKQGQLTMETMSKVAQAEAGTEARQLGQPSAASKEGEGREVETPMNVIQRSKQETGGAANLTATPKQ